MRRITAVLSAGALLLLAGCQSGVGGPSADGPAATPTAPPAQVSITPATGTTDVPPMTPVQLSVTAGRLADVSVADSAHHAVAGRVSPSETDPSVQVWTPSTPLRYATRYTVTATAENAASDGVDVTSTFRTVAPATLSVPAIGPLDGTTVGVGMPIRVYFDQPVTDKAAVQAGLQVTSSTPTDGAWSWRSSTEVHFRPSTYWPAHTTVTLAADLYGVDFGDGVWGKKDRTVSFTIGDEHISVADASAHTLTVRDGGQVVQTFPMSAGSAENPTRNGAHVVLEKFADITMDSSTFGLAVDAPGGYRTDVKFATRISNNGEFVHAAPWSVDQQGSTNVSHGCINLSTDRAQWFYDFSRPGDVVEVVNSVGPTLGPADGDIYDWTVPWDAWVAGSALP